MCFTHGTTRAFNVEWLFPTFSNITNIFDNFCNLSLTYRSNESVTMPAPLRDHLYPENPKSSQLLYTTKDCYSNRLSVDPYPDNPGFEEARWITSEDVNIEHLLGVFTSPDMISDDIWSMCSDFMDYLYWQKPRLVALGPGIEGLPDDHPSKPRCLTELSLLFGSVGNDAESKRLLSHSLRLWREWGDALEVAQTLTSLSDVNRRLGLHEEGIPQAKEAADIYEQLCDKSGQRVSLRYLAWSFYGSNQLDAAEEAVSRALDLSSSEGDQFQVSQCHYLLGNIYRSKGESESATDRFETALGIASRFDWPDWQFWCHYSLAMLFFDEGRLNDAYTHIGYSMSHAVNDAYNSGCGMRLHADILLNEGRFEEAKFKALCAAETFEKFKAAQDLKLCRGLLQSIEKKLSDSVATHEPDSDGELPETAPFPPPINSAFFRSGLRVTGSRFAFTYPSPPYTVSRRVNAHPSFSF